MWPPLRMEPEKTIILREGQGKKALKKERRNSSEKRGWRKGKLFA